MKSTKKLTGILLTAVLLCAACVPFVLTGCGPEKPVRTVSYGDIYVTRPSVSPYAVPAGPVLTLGEGVSVTFTENKPFFGPAEKDYSSAYLKDADLLLCVRASDERYGAYMLGADPVRPIGRGVAYKKIFSGYGFVVCVTPENSVEIYDCSGTPIVCADGPIPYDGSRDIERVLVPIGEEYVALRSGGDRYKILRREGNSLSEIKTPEGRPWELESAFAGKDKSLVFGLKAVDGYILKTVYGGTGIPSVQDVYVYDAGSRSLVYDVFEHYGDYASGMVRVVFYLGDGRVYCCQKTKAGEKDGYTCTITDDKGKDANFRVFSWLRDLRTGEERRMGKKVFFLSVFNSYYAAEAPFDVDGFVRKGYTYVSLGYRIGEDGKAVPEQYILDSDLHPYVSMISREGTSTRYDDSLEDVRDVLLTFVEGAGFSPDSSGDIVLYDQDGYTILTIPGDFSKTRVNNGIVTALQKFVRGDKTVEYYAAFNLDGTPVFDAEARRYTEMSAYVGGYALAKTEDSKAFILDSRGKEYEVPLLHRGKNVSRLVFHDGVYFSEDRDAAGELRVGVRGCLPGDRNTSLIPESYYRTVLVERKGGGLYCMALTAKENGVWEIFKLL